jgi:hypothetical protein
MPVRDEPPAIADPLPDSFEGAEAAVREAEDRLAHARRALRGAEARYVDIRERVIPGDLDEAIALMAEARLAWQRAERAAADARERVDRSTLAD